MKRRDFIKSVVTLATLAPIASNKAVAGLSEDNNNSERKNLIDFYKRFCHPKIILRKE